MWYEENHGLPVPNYYLNLLWPEGKRGYVEVMFTANYFLVNTEFDGKDVPKYRIVEGGEALEAFARQVAGRGSLAGPDASL